MDTPASPPIEIVEVSKLFCSPTNPRRNDEAVPPMLLLGFLGDLWARLSGLALVQGGGR